MKKAAMILLAGIVTLTACQSRQIVEKSKQEEIPSAEQTTDTAFTCESAEILHTEEAPAVPTVEAEPQTVESQPELDREPQLFRPTEVAQAALEEYLTEWERREDGSRITEYNFHTNDDMLLIYNENQFIVYAYFTVLPEQYGWQTWGGYGEPGEDGRITAERFFTIERSGAEYHVSGIGTGAFHRPYSDLVAGIAAGEKPDEFSLSWFCPSEVAEYVLTEHFEQAKQDEQHPISDFSFEIDSNSVVSEGNGAFSFIATVCVLPTDTSAENIGYWTGANGVTSDNGWIESSRSYSLERENGVFRIVGTGTGIISIPYLSDEWNMLWS